MYPVASDNMVIRLHYLMYCLMYLSSSSNVLLNAFELYVFYLLMYCFIMLYCTVPTSSFTALSCCTVWFQLPHVMLYIVELYGSAFSCTA